MGDTHATWNEKSAENCCPDLLNDECGHFWRGNNCGVECTRAQRQRLPLDSRRGGSESYSGRAFRVADRTASASTLQSVAHKTVMATHGEPGVISRPLAMASTSRSVAQALVGRGADHFDRLDFLLLPAFFKAMATACFCGLPAFISVLMFELIVLCDEPFFRGIITTRFFQWLFRRI